jgi:hypothetical protein
MLEALFKIESILLQLCEWLILGFPVSGMTESGDDRARKHRIREVRARCMPSLYTVAAAQTEQQQKARILMFFEQFLL